jgi:outer membrane murein-binding lipoprotein Lpp
MKRQDTKRQLVIVIAVVVGLLAVGGCREKEAAADIAGATVAQCNAERSMLENAIEAYLMLEGNLPTSEAAMVPDYLRIQSVYFDLDAQANLVPAPNSSCT